MSDTKTKELPFFLGAIVLGLWAAAAFWGVPWLIRQAHAGESLPVFNRMIESPDQTAVERYLSVWNRFALTVTLGLAVLAGAGLLLWKQWPRLAGFLRAAVVGLPARGVSGALLLAVWIGIVAGLLEAANTVVRYAVKHLPTGDVTWGEVFWATPVAAALSLAVIALLLAGADRLFHARGAVIGTTAFVLPSIAAYSFLRALTIGIHEYAAIVLALGIGVTVWRAFAKDNPTLRRFVRATTPALAAGLVVWSLALAPARRVAERRALEALPAAPTVSMPNVLIIIWDAVRAHNLSSYGYDRETTPNLDRFAAAGSVFERAVSTTSWSLPSHASLLTGQWPHDLSADRSTPLDGEHRTLAEALSSNGYVTGGFMANLFFGGQAYGLGRGFSWWDDRAPMQPKLIVYTWWLSRRVVEDTRELIGNHQRMLRRQGDDVTDRFLEWAGRHPGRPFFATLNYFDAHDPYLPPEPFDRTFASSPVRYWVEPTGDLFPETMLAELETAYDNCIRYLDAELARLMAELERRGQLDNTLVIVTADHGEEFGEHSRRITRHGDSLEFPALHVPLILWGPQIPRGVRNRDPVSIRDVPVTVMDVVGGTGRQPFPGTSLLARAHGAEAQQTAQFAFLRNPATGARRAQREHDDTYSVLFDRFQYILTPDGKENLRDVQADVMGMTDLADLPAYAEEIAKLRAMQENEFGASRR